MKKLLLPFLFLFFNGVSGAFFWGRMSQEKAIKLLAEMSASEKAGDCDSALEFFGDFLNEKPSDKLKEKAYKTACVCYEKKGQTDKALSLYKLSVLIYPDNEFFRDNLGALYYDSGFYDEAGALLEESLKKNPYDYKASLTLARVYRKTGFLKKAKTLYLKKILTSDFASESLMEEYFDFLIEKNDASDALFVAEEGLKKFKNQFFYCARGRALAYLGKKKKAFMALTEAEERYPESSEIRIRRTLYSFFSGAGIPENELSYFKIYDGELYSFFSEIKNYGSKIKKNTDVSSVYYGETESSFVKKILQKMVSQEKK